MDREVTFESYFGSVLSDEKAVLQIKGRYFRRKHRTLRYLVHFLLGDFVAENTQHKYNRKLALKNAYTSKLMLYSPTF